MCFAVRGRSVLTIVNGALRLTMLRSLIADELPGGIPISYLVIITGKDDTIVVRKYGSPYLRFHIYFELLERA